MVSVEKYASSEKCWWALKKSHWWRVIMRSWCHPNGAVSISLTPRIACTQAHRSTQQYEYDWVAWKRISGLVRHLPTLLSGASRLLTRINLAEELLLRTRMATVEWMESYIEKVSKSSGSHQQGESCCPNHSVSDLTRYTSSLIHWFLRFFLIKNRIFIILKVR